MPDKSPTVPDTDAGPGGSETFDDLESRRIEEQVERARVENDILRIRRTLIVRCFWFIGSALLLLVCFIMYSLYRIVPAEGVDPIVKVFSIATPIAAGTVLLVAMSIGVFRGFRGRDSENLPAEAIVDTIVRRAANRDA